MLQRCSATTNFTAGRFDAEYHAPHVQQLIARLSAGGLQIRDVARWRKERFLPRRRKPFHYIEIGDLTADGLAESTELPGDEVPDRSQWTSARATSSAPPCAPSGRLSALIRPEQEGYVCHSGFAVLAPHAVPAEVLLTYLRLPVFCELVNPHTTASMYPAIAATDLLHLPFAAPPTAAIPGIVASVRAAHTARYEARTLLALAKQAVGRAKPLLTSCWPRSCLAHVTPRHRWGDEAFRPRGNRPVIRVRFSPRLGTLHRPARRVRRCCRRIFRPGCPCV